MLNHYDYWRRQRTIRQGVVVSVILALAVGVFLAIIQVMNSGFLAQVAAGISSSTNTPALSDEYDDYEDDAASQENTEQPESPSE